MASSSSMDLGAGLAGASGGTGFVAFVSLLPDDAGLKQVAQYIAPSAAIIMSMIWIYILTWIETSLADRRLSSELKKAEEDNEKVQHDPNASDDLKEQMRKKVEALQLLKFNIHTNRVEAIVDQKARPRRKGNSRPR